MDNPTVSGLRSRSRSKTPIKRSTPIKEFRQTTKITETISESPDEFSSPPAYRTRQSIRNAEMQTSDYSSEDAMDRLRHHKEIFENEINNQYERRVSTSSQHGYSVLDDVSFSPIQTSFNVIQDRSKRYGSPSTSICSTDSSFTEQALANTNALLIANPNSDHLPSRLYKMAGEYWNKYPKTDYTYSPLSKDRVELAPGQIAMPNMSRRSLSHFRVQGPNVSDEEMDRLAASAAWTTKTLRKRYISLDSSDDEGGYYKMDFPEERWWITQVLVYLMTIVNTVASHAYRKVVGPSHRYPYTDRQPKVSIASQAAAVVTAPFYWIYTLIKKVVTTTITTVTETITPNHVAQTGTYVARPAVQDKRRWWPWLLLLLLPAVGYGSHYTYENWDQLAVPNFTDFQLDLTEFTNKMPAFPNITFADLNILPSINLTMPDINITLPDIRENLPEVKKAYNEYKDIVQNRVADASDYMKVVAESCFEEVWRLWRGVI